jgi:hypothetical protein
MTIFSFETVRELGLSLPDVTDGTSYGAPALKLGGKVLACTPTNKSAETNCVAVHIDFERRTQLLEQHPETYYITDHYAPYPTVLVRLSKVTRAELRRLLHDAHTFVSLSPISKAASTKKRATPPVHKLRVTKSSRKQ